MVVSQAPGNIFLFRKQNKTERK